MLRIEIFQLFSSPRSTVRAAVMDVEVERVALTFCSSVAAEVAPVDETIYLSNLEPDSRLVVMKVAVPYSGATR